MVLTSIMVLCVFKKVFKSHILVLEIKSVQSCSHTFLLKSSYYKDDHEKNIINNLNFIKKPDSYKLINWFSDEFHANHIVQCKIDEKKLPEFKYYFTKYKAINETSKHIGAPIDLTQEKIKYLRISV